MLKKNNRIRRNKEFDRAFKTGKYFYSKVFSLKAADNDLEVSRLGILISTKVSKKAVVRNLLKRQIRAVIQGEIPQLKTGKDLVIVVFSQILDKNFKEIKEFLELGLKRLKLYK
jgi:ribonuclease P protein component